MYDRARISHAEFEPEEALPTRQSVQHPSATVSGRSGDTPDDADSSPGAIWSSRDKCVVCVGSNGDEERGRLVMKYVRWGLAKANIAEIDSAIGDNGKWCIAIDSEALAEADSLVRAAWEFANGGPRHGLRKAAKQLRRAHSERRKPAPPKAEEPRVRKPLKRKRTRRPRTGMGIGVTPAGMGD